MRFANDEIEHQIRLKAFEHITNLPKQDGLLHVTQLNEAFSFKGERITLHNRQKGIHKPSQMQSLLSIKTVYPKSHNQVKYRDQIDIYKKYMRVRTNWTTLLWAKIHLLGKISSC